MKAISLTQGKSTIVDDDAPAWIFDVKWYAQRARHNFYAVREMLCIDGKRRAIRLHRIIVRAPQGLEVDHIDGDGLNNLRANLRICNNIENQHGYQRKPANTSSEFRGVCWHKATGKWLAQIQHNCHRLHIGLFDDEVEAARAFDTKARELGWPESGLNFPR